MRFFEADGRHRDLEALVYSDIPEAMQLAKALNLALTEFGMMGSSLWDWKPVSVKLQFKEFASEGSASSPNEVKQ